MSTIRRPTLRFDLVEPSKMEARPKAITGSWADFFYGVGSVLELVPSGDMNTSPDLEEEAMIDPEETLLQDCERINSDMCAAFVPLASQYEEMIPMPPAPKFTGLLLPELLEQYKQVIPDLPERWLATLEEETQHRRQLEVHAQEMKAQAQELKSREQEAHFAERIRGQLFGFAIGVIAIVAGSLTAVYGAQWAGLGIGGGGVIGLVSVFVMGKRGK